MVGFIHFSTDYRKVSLNLQPETKNDTTLTDFSIINNNVSDDVMRAKQRFSIIGSAPALNNAVERAIRVAPIDLSVLITGESGSGKEFFPQIIHTNSPRKHNKYIAVNCGAIPEGTIDSELFGHEKGAFTGAIASRKGYFEEASGGTIFLDEVAELPMTTQARLLRVLETGEFIKVGSSEVQKTNIRVVAATNVDMAKAVAEGRFREDLYYRLSTVEIHVPPLRERGNDILLLTRKFLGDFAEKYHTPSVTFDDEARLRMTHYSWPGNVRQLKNVVEQIALFEGGTVVDAATLAEYLPMPTGGFTPTVAPSSSHAYEREREMLFNMIFRLQNEIDELRAAINERDNEQREPLTLAREAESTNVGANIVRFNPNASSILNQDQPIEDVEDVEATPHLTLEDTERETIKAALYRNQGRRKAAAKELNISERTLYRKIKDYGLDS